MIVHLVQRNIVIAILSFLWSVARTNGFVVVKNDKQPDLNLVVVGAGPAGLVSAKQSIASGHRVTVYEQNEDIGGTWVYTENVGRNKYGMDVHTAMYTELRTNTPITTLKYPDHDFPNDTQSYPSGSVVLKYLHSYADRFNLRKHIKLNHVVVHVNPIDNGKWELIIRDLENDEYLTKVYDAVFVCNGANTPFIPSIQGADEFKGKFFHSRDYRSAEAFRDEEILIIGVGPSGRDLVFLLSDVVKSVTLSKRNWLNDTDEGRETYQNRFPKKLVIKDVVKRFTSKGAEFIDGSQKSFSVIIFATGYRLSYSFLSVDSGIHVDNKIVQPLYKQVINIDYPTMAFFGLPGTTIRFTTLDLQARFALKIFSKEKALPSKSDMEAESKIRGIGQDEYFNQLSSIADTKPVPSILFAIANDAWRYQFESPAEFRDYEYKIIDEKTYKREKISVV